MATKYAQGAGSFTVIQWYDAPTGGNPVSTPGASDDAVSNNNAITIDADITVNSLRNTNTLGGTAGGGFTASVAVGVARTITLGGTSANAGIFSANTVCLTLSSTGAGTHTIKDAYINATGTANCVVVSASNCNFNLIGTNSRIIAPTSTGNGLVFTGNTNTIVIGTSSNGCDSTAGSNSSSSGGNGIYMSLVSQTSFTYYGAATGSISANGGGGIYISNTSGGTTIQNIFLNGTFTGGNGTANHGAIIVSSASITKLQISGILNGGGASSSGSHGITTGPTTVSIGTLELNSVTCKSNAGGYGLNISATASTGPSIGILNVTSSIFTSISGSSYEAFYNATATQNSLAFTFTGSTATANTTKSAINIVNYSSTIVIAANASSYLDYKATCVVTNNGQIAGISFMTSKVRVSTATSFTYASSTNGDPNITLAQAGTASDAQYILSGQSVGGISGTLTLPIASKVLVSNGNFGIGGSGTTPTYIDANLTTANVRKNVAFGVSPQAGALEVPAVASVLVGVPVDNTVGTLDIATSVWGASVKQITSVASGGITNASFADNAISNAKVADGAISNTKLADNAISASKIAQSAIGTNIGAGIDNQSKRLQNASTDATVGAIVQSLT
jgi:hypothetical protein